jgi:hypothetical protein
MDTLFQCFVCKGLFDLDDLSVCRCGEGCCDSCNQLGAGWACECSVTAAIAALETPGGPQ